MNLEHFIRHYDAELAPDLCARMIESFNGLSRFHQLNGRTERPGLEESAWTEINVTRLSEPTLQGFFRQRISLALQRYNADIGLAPIAIPDSPRTADLILKRYRPDADESFQTHFDSIHDVANRYLVFLWYLNDVDEGGETEFPQLGLKVRARTGRLLMFPPYWMYQHAGLAPRSSEKYILSTYLLF
ncbi:MAG: 2OG-Fe(II) oxygenase [Gammaproteobacteria bacterium]